MFYSGQHVDSLERVLVEQFYEMLGTSLDFCIDFEWEAYDINDDQDVKGVRGVLKTTHSHSQQMLSCRFLFISHSISLLITL